MSATKVKSRQGSVSAPAANGKPAASKAKLTSLLKLETVTGTPLGKIQERAAEGFFEAQLQLLYAVVLNDEPDLSFTQFIDRVDEMGLDEFVESIGVEL